MQLVVTCPSIFFARVLKAVNVPSPEVHSSSLDFESVTMELTNSSISLNSKTAFVADRLKSQTVHN